MLIILFTHLIASPITLYLIPGLQAEMATSLANLVACTSCLPFSSTSPIKYVSDTSP